MPGWALDGLSGCADGLGTVFTTSWMHFSLQPKAGIRPVIQLVVLAVVQVDVTPALPPPIW